MAVKANITMDQGTTFSTQITLTDANNNPLNLTGYTGESQMRKWYTSNTATNFNIALANGVIILSMDANTTASITDGRYVYDVKLTDASGNVTRIVEGQVTVTPEVSM